MEILKDETENRIVFHYNKAHNQDTTIPQWVIKHKGNTYYVSHVSSKIGFATKETPDSEHTKGSLQFKGKLLITEEDSVKTAEIY
jgi:ribosomal protein L39E